TQAAELVEERRQRTDAPTVPPEESRTRKEALERFAAAESAVRDGLTRLRKQRLPRLFAGWTFVLLGLALWGILFAASYFLVDPLALGFSGLKPAGHVLLSAGIGFA